MHRSESARHAAARAQDIAPGVVAVSHYPGPGTVHNAGNVALRVPQVPVIRPVVFYARRADAVIVDVQRVAALRNVRQLAADVDVFRCHSVYRLHCPQAVGVVAEAHGRPALAHSSQLPPVLPRVRPFPVGQQVPYGTRCDVGIVDLRQQILLQVVEDTRTVLSLFVVFSSIHCNK